MKKLVAIMAVSALLITGNISFALGTQPADKPVKNVQSTQVENKQDKSKEVKETLNQIFEGRKAIISNKATLRQDFLSVKSLIKELREELRENKEIDTEQIESLTEQLESLKELLGNIKDERLKLNNAIADCAKEIHALRMAKKNGEEIGKILDNISDLQDVINEDLETIKKDLETIKEKLEEMDNIL